MRSVLYRFPDLPQFEGMIEAAAEASLELGIPSGEKVQDGDWVLAIFDLGSVRRAISVAARATVDEDGARLVFEPRDSQRLLEFARVDAKRPSIIAPAPSTPPPERPSQPTARDSQSGRAPARILVVDDDADIRDVVSAMLEAVGLVVATAESAESALKALKASRHDLVVLDWNLPGMTGVELCKQVRRDKELAHVPVLFLTANASSQDMIDAFACGADDYVVKPFRAPELGARIFSLLRRSRRYS